MKYSVYHLTLLSFALGAISVAVLSLAVSTDSWLRTREKCPQNNYTFLVRAGMWRVCTEVEVLHEELSLDADCMSIIYEDVSIIRNQNDTLTSLTIIMMARKAVPLPVSALIISITGAIFTALGNIRRDVRTLVGAVCHVLAGLALAVGMILYISAVNDEVGYRRTTMMEEDGFSYEYGWSFFSAGAGFLASEMAAVAGITLFLKRNHKVEDMVKIIPGLEEKVDPELVHHGTCGVHNVGAL